MKEFTPISPEYLQAMLDQDHKLEILNVLSEDAYKQFHISGSKNVCVYETVFPEKIRETFPDKKRPIVVYGLDDQTLEATTAIQKLRQLGYHKLFMLEGGMQAWRGFMGLTPFRPEPKKIPSATYHLDPARSIIRWIGSNPFNHHEGTLHFRKGHIRVENESMKIAEFIIDMNTIACNDLTDTGMNKMLIEHLRSDDFFNVEHHPGARLTISSATPLLNATPGTANYQLTGQLTLRGITNPLTFPAIIALSPDNEIAAHAWIDLDRTKWNIFYGSGKLFAFLGKHLVNDLIQLHVKITASMK